MCLIAVAWHAHRRYPLVLAANRDEFHDRPSAALARWDDIPEVIGGRDLRGGGSWLAATRGRLAAVTNYRQSQPLPAPRSRGLLVSDFLRSQVRAAAFACAIEVAADQYGPFNLLSYDGEELVWTTSRPRPLWKGVAPGVHGVSNGAPSFVASAQPWPKVRRLTDALERWLPQLDARGEPEPQPLFAALADDRPAASRALPDTGVGAEAERRLSPPFIRGRGYGTRCSTVGWVERDGGVVLVERRFGAEGVFLGETRARV
ncbi:MAG: NRDE family protein [Gammaproteobacteria bacterium]|nr:NRDE family protein [Gammaproteobacteria bacterium]